MHTNSTGPTFKTFSNLYPAILECFTIILLGYIAGRTRIVAPSQARGLGNYVTYFALPALIFKSMVELDFTKVNWLFWSAVLLAKAVVFVVVYVFSLVLARDMNIGRAGIFAIFATQSNDFALGYPIVLSLYKDHNPEFVQYIYLFAPISLALLNPAAFLSLEIQRGSREHSPEGAVTQDTPEGGGHGRCRMIWRVVKGLITNPVMVMVIAGIVGNFAFQQRLPSTLSGILDVLGESFSATALFYLGTSMVGKFSAKQSGYYFVVPTLLVAAKLILNPLLIRQLVFAMEPGGHNTSLTESYSTLGFLYGTIPTAPSVFMFATYYQESAGIIATSLVLCTFISAPFMFVTATLVLLPIATMQDYQRVLDQTIFDVSCLGMVSCLWILLIFVLGRRAKRLPHEFTVQLVLAQLMAVFGAILCTQVNKPAYWQQVVQFVLYLCGVIATRNWTAMLALGLCLVRCRSTCVVIRYRFWFYMYGWGTTFLGVGLMIAAHPSNLNTQDVIYLYGDIQLIFASLALVINTVIVIVSLIVLFKCDRYQRGSYQGIPGQDSGESEQLLRDGDGLDDDVNNEQGNEDPSSNGSNSTHPSRACPPIQDIEDITMGSPSIQNQLCRSNRGCDTVQRDTCRRRLWVRHLEHLKIAAEDDYDVAECHQMGRHIVLLFLLLMSMIIGLFVCLWKLFTSNAESGISLELEFLDIVFSFGQGFFVLATFGFDTKYVIMPVVKFFRKLIYGVEKIQLPPESDLDPDIVQSCLQFKTHHLQQCEQSIVRDIRHGLKILNHAFYGRDLVDWIVQHGLACDRSDAVTYGHNLLMCRYIEHIEQQHHFHDRQYIYRFTTDEF